MRSVPQGQMVLGDEWVTGLIRLPRGEYHSREWNGITWPFVWRGDEQRWYVGRTRLAIETLGVSPEGLKERLGKDAVVMTKDLLVKTSKGDRSIACFPFDDLPYVLQGIELNACGEAIRPHLLYLKSL